MSGRAMTCLFHKWPAWSDYGRTEGGWPIQSRRCERCGKLKMKVRMP